MSKKLPTYSVFVNEHLNERTFNEIYKKKNKWIRLIDSGKIQEIADNLWVLIQNSYAPLGGHPSIPDVSAVFNPKIYYWEAIDTDNDPDANVVLFGRLSPQGIKISGMGHDKTKKSKKILLQKLQDQLRKRGYWIESSDRVEELMYKANVPYVDNKKDVEKVFGQEVEWLGDKGKYRREVSPGKFHIETIFGKPKL